MKKKLLILCVDGLDSNKVNKLNLKMKYNLKLLIPNNCCIYENGVYIPHTFTIWKSIFSKKTNKDVRLFINKSILSKFDDLLHRIGNMLKDKNMNKYPFTFPIYIKEKNILKEYNSINWNIPTISIDYIYYLYDWQDFKKYCLHEYNLFKTFAFGSMLSVFDVIAIYTRIIDVYEHIHIDTENIYKEIFLIANELSKKVNVLLISDHATNEEGEHLKYSYFGSNIPIKGNSILDIKENIKEYLENGEYQ